MRSEDMRRHHRRRVIARRVAVIRQAWRRNVLGWHEGQLSKHNLVCSCPMCRDEKYRDHDRARLKQELRKETTDCGCTVTDAVDIDQCSRTGCPRAEGHNQ